MSIDFDQLKDKIDWAKLAPALEPKPPLYSPHTPHFKQKVFLLVPGIEALYGGRAGGGKALALDTEIPGPDGFKTMGELAPGDLVYDETRSTQQVLACSEVMTDKQCFEVVFDDGGSVVASADHLWKSHTYASRVGEAEPSILTTAEMYETQNAAGHPNHAVPSNLNGTQLYRYVVSIKAVDSVPVKCIKVSGESKLFLATRSYIATHNSDALLMAALQYVDVPGYSAVIFRNSYSDLALPGALMDRAREWLEPHIPEVRWSSKTNSWIFPAGATLTFGYLDKPDDHYRYKGAEFQFVGFDEVTEIREKHYLYLFSRLRKPAEGPLSKVPIRCRAASNPAPNWVRQRFIESPVDAAGNRRIYVPAGLDDNPFVNQESYRQSLAMLDSVERARLEAGDWYADEPGAKFNKAWFSDRIITIEDIPDGAWGNRVRYWDIAATLPSEKNKDPDYTVGALVSEVDGVIIIHDIRRARLDPGGVEDLIYQTAHEDGPDVRIRMEQEGGGSGKITIDHYSRHVLLGFDFDGHPAVRNKEARADAWAGKAKRGEVLLVRDNPRRPWIPAFLDEASTFGAVKDAHDDQIDAVSGAFEVLTGIGQKQKRRLQIIV